MLAILCDGRTYHAARTPGDREIVQPGVLKSLGWNLIKVWSAAWWEDPESVLQYILDQINRAQKGLSVEPEADTEPAPAAEVPFSFKATTAPVVSRTFYEAAVPEIVRATSTEDFFLWGYRDTIRSQIESVMAVEAPVSKNLLAKRVLTGWGINRLGPRIAAHFDAIVQEMRLQQTSEGGDTVYWRSDQQPDSYQDYRLPPNETLKRDAEDLPAQEVANGVKAILQNQISLNRDDLVRETAKLFGYVRAGSNVEAAMQSGITVLLKRGVAEDQGDRIALR